MAQPRSSSRLLIVLLNLAASVQVAWFYVAYVPSGLNLQQYEQGLERTPFQQRLLMMYPLRWAHDSKRLNQLAHRLTAMPAWFPHGVRAEGIVEAALDLSCIVITGLVARGLYRASSQRNLFASYVYPLTLLMVTATYCLNTMHRLRFVFDLPSMTFFSLGLYLIYFKRSRLLFAALFAIATFNRETTLFLLPLYLLKRYVDVAELRASSSTTVLRKKVFDFQTAGLLLVLTVFWAGWHLWANHHFIANPTASGPRFWLNIGTLLWPTSWVQILCTFAFCGPLCVLGRKYVKNRTLQAWYWILPIWFFFMMRFGILVETRIFGELIPYLACTAAIIAEEHMLHRIENTAATSGYNFHLLNR